MTMSPQRFQAIRKKLGLTATEMAAHLHMPNPASSGRTAINRYERGYQAGGIPGPLAVAAEALESGFRAKCETCARPAKARATQSCKNHQCPFQKKAV